MIGAMVRWRTLLGLLRPRQPMTRPGEATSSLVPQAILAFLDSHHVVGLAVSEAAGSWAASCFYAFDAATMTLIVMTSVETRHGRAMLACPRITGTVAGQPSAITDIRGLQLEATARRLHGIAEQEAMLSFVRRHPVALALPSDVWALKLDAIKYTDNRVAFARKLHWSRSADERIAKGGNAS